MKEFLIIMAVMLLAAIANSLSEAAEGLEHWLDEADFIDVELDRETK